MSRSNIKFMCGALVLLAGLATAFEGGPFNGDANEESPPEREAWWSPMGLPHIGNEANIEPAPSMQRPSEQQPQRPPSHNIVRRQISYPSIYNQQQQQPAQFPAQQQPPQAPQEQGGVFKFFNDLAPQAKMVSSLLSGGSSAGNGGAVGAPNSSGFNPVVLMSQLSELIRATQDRNAKLVETTQRTVDQAGQETTVAAKQAQGGIQAALQEIGTGLQRLAANNPLLLPDIKNLYQSVASKLSSASSSVAQAAVPKNGAEQFAEQLAKAGQV